MTENAALHKATDEKLVEGAKRARRSGRTATIALLAFLVLGLWVDWRFFVLMIPALIATAIAMNVVSSINDEQLRRQL